MAGGPINNPGIVAHVHSRFILRAMFGIDVVRGIDIGFGLSSSSRGAVNVMGGTAIVFADENRGIGGSRGDQAHTDGTSI
jgi:hypothetical protein